MSALDFSFFFFHIFCSLCIWTLLLSSGKSIWPQSDDSLSLYSPIFTCPVQVKLNRLSELKNSSNFARQIELHLCVEKANKYIVATNNKQTSSLGKTRLCPFPGNVL